MLVRQTDDARAVNRALDVAGETGDEGVGFAAAAEEGHVDAVDIVLIDEHGDVAADLEHAQELERRVEASRDEISHAALAKFDDCVAHRADIGSAVEHRRVEPGFGRGPSLRMKTPAKSAIRFRWVARIIRNIATASDPSAASMPVLACRCIR